VSRVVDAAGKIEDRSSEVAPVIDAAGGIEDRPT
jgi:hypothetical protein